MGLPSLTLNADLAKDWCTILEMNGLSVSPDDTEPKGREQEPAPRRLWEVLWRVGDGNAELKLLHATFRDQPDRDALLVFMPVRTHEQRRLITTIQEILIASGAAMGTRKGGRAKGAEKAP